jgi:hypothetical protein
MLPFWSRSSRLSLQQQGLGKEIIMPKLELGLKTASAKKVEEILNIFTFFSMNRAASSSAVPVAWVIRKSTNRPLRFSIKK